MNTVERIKKVIEFTGKGAVALSVEIGLSRTRIDSMIRKNVQAMPSEVAEAINRKYPTISLNWLMFDRGDMLVHQQEDTTPKTDNSMAKMFSSVATLMEKMAEIVERMDSRQEQSEERYAKLVERILEFAEQKEQNRKSYHSDLLSENIHKDPDKQQNRNQNT